jgi:hypothetical protein
VNGGGTQQQIMVGGEVTVVGEGRLHVVPGGEAC